ncbi:MAG: CopD family protein [Anaerolineales bacterium]|nr:CopD family protein [Anaerolineales bacterium]
MSSPVPAWALTAAYALHMLATIVLVGGLFVLSVLWLPAASRSLSAHDQANLLRAISRRFQPLAWLSIAVLVATGMTQMAASPNYLGLLAIDNLWSAAMLAKHTAFGAMLALAAYQTWVVTPTLERQALLRAADTGLEGRAATASQQRLLRINLWIGIVILGLTAIARTA